MLAVMILILGVPFAILCVLTVTMIVLANVATAIAHLAQTFSAPVDASEADTDREGL